MKKRQFCVITVDSDTDDDDEVEIVRKIKPLIKEKNNVSLKNGMFTKAHATKNTNNSVGTIGANLISSM